VNDPATPNRERKRMVRVLIEDITIRKGEQILLEVRFRGGVSKALALPRPLALVRSRIKSRSNSTIPANTVMTILPAFEVVSAQGSPLKRASAVRMSSTISSRPRVGGFVGCGTVFSITPDGTLTTLYDFCAKTNCPDGNEPLGALVLRDTLTHEGGATNQGTVFEVPTGGTLLTLYSFYLPGAGGYSPDAGLVQASNGNFYGTTFLGGAHADGTVFEITAGGVYTQLHSFDGADGLSPAAGLVQGTNGNFYGTTWAGGASDNCLGGCGTVFEITPGGALTTLHSFDGADGEFPKAGLVRGTDGNFYGTTSEGGALGYGTVFSLAVGLGPFVETNPTSGLVGNAVAVLGSGLTGTTSVTFNGTKAEFKVVSSTEITTNVPSGATTGTVKVTTPSRTLSSNVVFRVIPSISSFSPTGGPVGTSVEIIGESLDGLDLHKGTKCEMGISVCTCRRYGCLVFATPKNDPHLAGQFWEPDSDAIP
jgi:uncharacterized repeat protein (TIGR03803 family)